MMKANKDLYTLPQRKNKTNTDNMKEFEAYIEVIESYVEKNNLYTLVLFQRRFIRWNLRMPTTQPKKKMGRHYKRSRWQIQHVLCWMGNITAVLGLSRPIQKIKMTSSSDIHPNSREKTVELINNYHVSKQLARTTSAKEELALTQKNSNTQVDTNTNKTNKEV